MFYFSGLSEKFDIYLNQIQCNRLMQTIDTDHNGSLEFCEFEKLCYKNIESDTDMMLEAQEERKVAIIVDAMKDAGKLLTKNETIIIDDVLSPQLLSPLGTPLHHHNYSTSNI